MSMVLVVDHERKPCAPVHPGRARHLLNRGRAAVLRRYPFTLILKAGERAGERAEEGDPLRLKIDPGSKTTGLAVVNDATGQVVWAAELAHRGEQVKARLDQRRRRHARQMCRTDAQGFPNKAAKATSVVGDLRTGDLVRALVPARSVKAGVYVGRLAVRATGSCNITTASGTVQGIHWTYCQPLQRGDGYTYTKGAVLPPQA